MIVEGRVSRRWVNGEAFADMAPAVFVRLVPSSPDGVGGIEFDRDLTPAQVDAVRWRMTSRDDADETSRRNIAALRDAAVTGGIEDIRALGLATAAYLLGET